jgi:hypothetical protein
MIITQFSLLFNDGNNLYQLIILGCKKMKMNLSDGLSRKGKKAEGKTLSLMSRIPNKDACREFAEEFHQSVLMSTQRKALGHGVYHY